KAALAAFGAGKVAGPVIVFGLPRPLPKGSAVSEAGPGPSGRGKTTVTAAGIGAIQTFTDTEKRLPAGTWLFWMDLAPYAHFEHSSVMVLVDSRGKAVRKQSLAWWPLVNGKAPAFIAPSGYDSNRYRVFSHGVSRGRAPAATRGVTAAQARSAVLEAWRGLAISSYPNDCIIVMSDSVDPIFTGDLNALDATAKKLGIPIENATSGNDLEAKVTKLSSATPACTDVVIYLDAHGYPAVGSNFPHPNAPGQNIPESAHAQVSLAHTEIKISPLSMITTVTKHTTLDAAGLREVMKAHMNLTFKLVVDSCFSGRWTELSDQSNLRVILAASRSDQMSFGYIPNGNWLAVSQTNAVLTNPGGTVNLNVTNPYQAGGFTNAITSGVVAWAAMPGATDLANGLVSAFNGSSAIDSSQLLGETVPGLTNFAASRPHAPPGGTGFQVTVAMTYHHIAPGSSEVCVKVTTVPPRGKAQVHLRVNGPGVVSGSDQNLTLGADGSLFVRIPINQYGEYTAGGGRHCGPRRHRERRRPGDRHIGPGGLPAGLSQMWGRHRPGPTSRSLRRG
ncbi:MAG: hypothetical protein ACXVZN_02505, partial [Gaiellaceae bacterium]